MRESHVGKLHLTKAWPMYSLLMRTSEISEGIEVACREARGQPRLYNLLLLLSQ
jgi:hypothetical protein